MSDVQANGAAGPATVVDRTDQMLAVLSRIEARVDSLAAEFEAYRYLLPEPGSLEAKAAAWKMRRSVRRGGTTSEDR